MQEINKGQTKQSGHSWSTTGISHCTTLVIERGTHLIMNLGFNMPQCLHRKTLVNCTLNQIFKYILSIFYQIRSNMYTDIPRLPGISAVATWCPQIILNLLKFWLNKKKVPTKQRECVSDISKYYALRKPLGWEAKRLLEKILPNGTLQATHVHGLVSLAK